MSRRLTFLFLLCAVIAPAVMADIVYENINSPFFNSAIQPRRALDDGFFYQNPGDFSLPIVVDQAAFGFQVTGTDPASLDVRLTFYGGMNPSADPVNSNPLGSFVVPFTNVAPGAIMTSLMPLPSAILFPGNSWGVEFEFLEPGTNTLSTRGTVLFAGSDPNGPTVGWSEDTYWRDGNLDEVYSPTEARWFGDGSNRANFYLQLNGRTVDPIPEPATLALLGFGVLPLIRRRK